MKAFFTRFVAFVAVLALLVTAETMAMARGASPAVSETILCSAHGIERIPLDAEGEPTSAPHICPECLLFFGAPVDTPRSVAAPIAATPIEAFGPTGAARLHRHGASNHARAPPVAL